MLTWNETQGHARAPLLFKHQTAKDRTPAERTPWPRLGDIKDGHVKPISFEKSGSTSHCAEGETARIYVAGSNLLRGLAGDLHLPLAKVGVSALPDLRIRQADLNRDQYGGWSYVAGRLVQSEIVRWELQRLPSAYQAQTGSPVTVNTRDIEVRLPEGYRFGTFERDFHHQLLAASLSAFSTKEQGVRHCKYLGIDPASLSRYTKYEFGAGRRVSMATEIYICRPREDVGRLTMIAERLIAGFLAAQSGTG